MHAFNSTLKTILGGEKLSCNEFKQISVGLRALQTINGIEEWAQETNSILRENLVEALVLFNSR